MQRILTSGALGALAILALVACAAAPGGDRSRDGASTHADEPSPLDEYLYLLSTDETLGEEEARTRHLAVEEYVAACMAGKGFDYTLTPYRSEEDFAALAPLIEPDSRSWVGAYGYGVVNMSYRGDGSSGGIGDESGPSGPSGTEGMSESERESYSEALNGPSSEETEDSVYDWRKAGCYGAAIHEVDGEKPTRSEEVEAMAEELNERLRAFWDDSSAWAGRADLEADWASCMSDAGYSGYEAQHEPYSEISQRAAQLRSSAAPERDELSAEGTSADADEDLDATTRAELGSLGETEILVALADLDCREETDYRERMDTIEIDAETRFVSDNRPALERLRAAVEQAGS